MLLLGVTPQIYTSHIHRISISYILIVKRRYSGLTIKKFETQIGVEREAEYLYYSKTSVLKVVKHVSEKSQSSWFVQFVAMLIAHYSHSLSAL